MTTTAAPTLAPDWTTGVPTPATMDENYAALCCIAGGCINVLAVNPDGTIVIANKAARLTIEYSPAGPVIHGAEALRQLCTAAPGACTIANNGHMVTIVIAPDTADHPVLIVRPSQ